MGFAAISISPLMTSPPQLPSPPPSLFMRGLLVYRNNPGHTHSPLCFCPVLRSHKYHKQRSAQDAATAATPTPTLYAGQASLYVV